MILEELKNNVYIKFLDDNVLCTTRLILANKFQKKISKVNDIELAETFNISIDSFKYHKKKGKLFKKVERTEYYKENLFFDMYEEAIKISNLEKIEFHKKIAYNTMDIYNMFGIHPAVIIYLCEKGLISFEEKSVSKTLKFKLNDNVLTYEADYYLKKSTIINLIKTKFT